MNKVEPTNRTLEEIFQSTREAFFKKNGYYGTEEDAIKLTDEARKEIQLEKEKYGCSRGKCE